MLLVTWALPWIVPVTPRLGVAVIVTLTGGAPAVIEPIMQVAWVVEWVQGPLVDMAELKVATLDSMKLKSINLCAPNSLSEHGK